MNGWDLAILALIVLALALSLFVIFRNRKKGKGCGDCSRCGVCRRENERENSPENPKAK